MLSLYFFFLMIDIFVLIFLNFAFGNTQGFEFVRMQRGSMQKRRSVSIDFIRIVLVKPLQTSVKLVTIWVLWARGRVRGVGKIGNG